MPYQRILNLEALLEHRSLFLFGPRQTGKTTYLHERYPRARFVDLLDARTFRELSARPEILRESLTPSETLVVIDEIQKLPALLDEVHLLIERDKSLRFILTGSSARKLRQKSTNLLAGRALTVRLHPLVSPEVEFRDLEKRLQLGGLPSVLTSAIPHEDLAAYVGTYLREEIQAEGFTRQIEAFSRFLEVAALSNGELLNFTQIASDAAVPSRTVQNYYRILEDTLVGYQLSPFRKTPTRKAVATAKFFFFDVGVVHALMGREEVRPRTSEYGRALEHLIFLELRAYLDYTRNRAALTFWRTHSKHEVDFLVGDTVAIEVKAKERVGEQDLRGVRALAQELSLTRMIVVSNEHWRRTTDDHIEIVPVDEFLHDLWSGNVL
ncbi:MAG: ATP-binding protein [Candidatus Binatia bacterium]